MSVISGCRDQASTADAGDASAFPAVELPFAGCAAVIRVGQRPVCELGPTSRTIRVAFPSGLRSIDVPKDAARVSVDGFVLEIREAKALPWLEEAKAARAKGDLDRARELAAPFLKGEEEHPLDTAFAEGFIARVDLAKGNATEAVPHFRAAITSHRLFGRISDAADDTFALAFALHQRSRRYDEARLALDQIATELAVYPEGRAREPYYRGILEGELGDHRGALALLRDASQRSSQLGMTKVHRNARSSTALEMQELGRAKEAQAILVELDKEIASAPDATPCERAEIANNLGWGQILIGEDARPALERALATECSDAYVRGFALGNLARVALRAGDPDLAAKRLAEAKAAVTEPRGIERIENRILEGKIALARKQSGPALVIFDEALALSRAAFLKTPEWSALTARADALVALGKKNEAAQSLIDAERVLDESSLLVPLGEGRASFVGDRGASARAAVELLIGLNRAADAARVARNSRARVLAGVERALRIASLSEKERTAWEAEVKEFRNVRSSLEETAADDWKLPADEMKRVGELRKGREKIMREALEKAMAVLGGASRPEDRAVVDPPLATGDLELVIHPGKTGWFAIARDAEKATAHSLPAPAPSGVDLAKALLDPIAARIDKATRLRVYAYGAWRLVDVHGLAFKDAPLVAQLAVDYPVGLGVGREPTSTDKVLVVGDPNGDLPSAGEEARAVAGGFPKERVTLLLRDDATTAKVTETIRTAGTFHYAGHGIYSGLEGWESALPLAKNGKLGVADVLSLAPAPARVVLSGCDSAKSEGDAEGLGLAQAFVAAGSKEVLAPTRPVPDVLAAKIASRIHRDNAPLANALRDAVSDLRKEDPKSDWAAFRVLAR